MIILGIDTDRGWAIVEGTRSKDRVLDAGTVKGLEEMVEQINSLLNTMYIDLVRIERPDSAHVYQRPGASPAAMRKIAVNVEQNMEKAKTLFYYCQRRGLDAELVPPLKGGTKLSPGQIKRLTGYSGRTSEHARDAIMLAFCY